MSVLGCLRPLGVIHRRVRAGTCDGSGTGKSLPPFTDDVAGEVVIGFLEPDGWNRGLAAVLRWWGVMRAGESGASRTHSTVPTCRDQVLRVVGGKGDWGLDVSEECSVGEGG